MKKISNFFKAGALAIAAATVMALVPATGMSVKAADDGYGDLNEPNDTRETATVLPIGQTISGEIGNMDRWWANDLNNDIDYFSVNLTAGTPYTITFNDWLGRYDETTLLILVYSPSNTDETHMSFSPYFYMRREHSNSYTFTPDESGTHFIKIYNFFDLNEDGNTTYQISITAGQAPAPTAAPTATPRPTPAVQVTPNPQGIDGFAERLYTCALDRDADQAGQDYWADALRHGTTGADAARGFLFSEEVANANLKDNVFVNRLYATLMDRAPAASETEYWVGCIADGSMTREDVFAGFINSDEWATVCVTYGILSGGTGYALVSVIPSDSINDFATRLYTTCLGREADTAGLKYWATELANLRITGSTAAQSYFFSEEFTNANVSNREFVNRLYLTFMDRNAASGEFDYWLEQMSNGMSREDVFGGFANSEEFGNICAEYGILR